MKSWKGIIVMAALVALAASASAQPTGKAIAVFWDDEATQQFASMQGGTNVYHTAYVFAVNCHQQIGGMAFKLDLDPRIESKCLRLERRTGHRAQPQHSQEFHEE